MGKDRLREIPYNYTSSDDGQIIRYLLGEATLAALERLRFQRRTGRLARLLMRFLGDMFILRRNPFVFEELLSSKIRQGEFFQAVEKDLHTISAKADDNPDLDFVIHACRTYLADMQKRLPLIRDKRRRLTRRTGAIVGVENVFCDPFTINAHITDATDWRLHPPFAVLRPTSEKQIAPLLQVISQMGFGLIPRGGGTGLTGGSVPVSADCVIINTEKLNCIHPIEVREFVLPGREKTKAAVLPVEAGVITEKAMARAAREELVFATDPTSAWACTIGGNIAENAGGKRAVLWGTAIDNLLSYRIVMPDGRHHTVRRKNHPLRKILPDDKVRFDIYDEQGESIDTIRLQGAQIRKKGLGKDITNKALGGLPGVQKEGTDGIITSAEFILHRAYPERATICLEFFGDDMDEAARVILAITEAFVNRGKEALMALEHFDEEYVRAIDYKTKAPRQDLPKAVLLIDMVGHNKGQISRGIDRLGALLQPFANTHLFVAADEIQASRYWRDRKRLGAIAARTNSFKLNEDIVLPLAKLAEFAQFADLYNIEEQRDNQRALIFQLGAYLEKAEPLEDPHWLADKIPTAKSLLMDTLGRLNLAGKQHLREETHVRRLVKDLHELLSGYHKVCREIDAIVKETRARVIVIATHMHAGDGNIHVNIPVFSNDREMMIRAAETADAVMAKAVALGGVVSGEHGIGFTKFKYLNGRKLERLEAYRRRVDPQGIMNPGKLSDPEASQLVFASSFDLLGIEAHILRHSSLEELVHKISKCVRCGRCKNDCCVFYPHRNLFYHPRNKNLALVALMEAILYEGQRFRSTRFAALQYLKQIADHCTICHKCLAPCPVNIDSGQVAILEREILEIRGEKKMPLATRLSLGYLDSSDPSYNALFRRVVIQGGGMLQRSAAWLLKRMPKKGNGGRKPSYMRAMLAAPMPRISEKPLRSKGFLPRCTEDQVTILTPPKFAGETVFYFPGCGSERLFAPISLAALYILLQAGIRILLPPPYLCCGFPARVNAKKDLHQKQALRLTLLLSQIRDMLGHMDFDALLVSCGTCMESLAEMELAALFGCRITDVGRYVLERGCRYQPDNDLYYHAPCHDSLNGGGVDLLQQYSRQKVAAIPFCCAEAGTLATTRPDIANAMRHRKRNAICPPVDPSREPRIVLTNCPACIQGLGRNRDLDIHPRHLAEELALTTGGARWSQALPSLPSRIEVMNF